MNTSNEPLTLEQREALIALEKHTGEWGALARRLEENSRIPKSPNSRIPDQVEARQAAKAQSVLPPLSSSDIARLETSRHAALASRLPRSRFKFGNSGIREFGFKIAAALALLASLTYFLLPRGSSNADIAILSPRGDTTSTRPVIEWKAQPGKSYDVWILPPKGDVLTAPALFKAEKVRPPVDFAALKPGKGQPQLAALAPGENYRVLVCYADTKRIGGIAISFYVQLQPAAKP